MLRKTIVKDLEQQALTLKPVGVPELSSESLDRFSTQEQTSKFLSPGNMDLLNLLLGSAWGGAGHVPVGGGR